MITTAQMYWLTRLDGIVGCLQAITIITGGTFLFLLIGGMITYFVNIGFGDDDRDVKKAKVILGLSAKVLAPCLIVLIALALLVPTTKEMAAIVIVPKIANSEKVQQTGNKLYDLAVEWMDALKPLQSKEAK